MKATRRTVRRHSTERLSDRGTYDAHSVSADASTPAPGTPCVPIHPRPADLGIQLVTASQHPHWATRLSSPARLVLAIMCRVALDTANANGDKPALYFGGHEMLVLHLTGASPSDPGFRAGKRKVERAVSELRAAGAVRLERAGRPGRNAVYEVRPSNLFTE